MIQAITWFVVDPKSASEFYRRVCGMPVLFSDNDSAVFKFRDPLVDSLRSEAAGELIHPAKVANAAGGARFVFPVHVEDVDTMCAELARRGSSY